MYIVICGDKLANQLAISAERYGLGISEAHSDDVRALDIHNSTYIQSEKCSNNCDSIFRWLYATQK